MPRKGVKGEEATEEERLLQLHQRAQAEEEMAKKKEETLTLYLKDKLQKEQRNSAVNLLKLTDSWRRILRQSRDGELLGDAEVLQQTSERKLDQLNFIIQRTMRELQEAERQADQVQRCHLQQVERLWEQQEKRLLGLQQRWESSLLDLSSTSSSQREKMLADLRHQNHRLVDLYLPAQIHDAGMSEYLQKVQQEVVDIYGNAHHELDSLAEEVKNLAEEPVLSWDLLQETRNYLDKLDQRISREQQEISNELRNVKRLKDKALQLRHQILSCHTEKVLMKQDWTSTKRKLSQKCLQLRDQLARDRQEARKKVADLSLQGAAATKNLQIVISKGEKVLQVAELCNKLQIQQEFLPRSPEEDRKLRNIAEQEVQESTELQELQQRLNSALLHREALRNHNEDLRRENQQLQVLLDQHDDSLHGNPAPLPVLQVPVGSGPPPADRRHTVIEAAHIVKHCLLDSWS